MIAIVTQNLCLTLIEAFQIKVTYLLVIQVVVKFIRRAKVFTDCWVQDDVHGRIPLEVSLLVKMDHPNIVKVSITFF